MLLGLKLSIYVVRQNNRVIMISLKHYNLIIFDCDGVVLDANNLKIDAMRESLTTFSNDLSAIEESVCYFKNNFGKSRFHHVEVFATKYFSLNESEADIFKEKVLNEYSKNCKSLYLESEPTPGILALLKSLVAESKSLYVASGSAQQELRDVFMEKGLYPYFQDILGSPTSKTINVKKILEANKSRPSVLIGDAISDFHSANENGADFIFYAPFSTVKEEMMLLCKQHNFPIINSFSEVLTNE